MRMVLSRLRGGEIAFGARGHAEHSVYFRDPDGNVLEIRHYDEAT